MTGGDRELEVAKGAGRPRTGPAGAGRRDAGPNPRCGRRGLPGPGRGCGLLALVLLLLPAAGDPPGGTQESRRREYRIKTAIIFQFARYVDWPKTAFKSEKSPFVVGVVGKNPFGDQLESLEGRIINGRKIRVRSFRNAKEAQKAHILFLGLNRTKEIREAVKTLSGSNVLTIGDRRSAARMGGVVGFFISKKKVAYAINLDAANAGKLRFNPKLVKLASAIYKDDA